MNGKFEIALGEQENLVEICFGIARSVSRDIRIGRNKLRTGVDLLWTYTGATFAKLQIRTNGLVSGLEGFLFTEFSVSCVVNHQGHITGLFINAKQEDISNLRLPDDFPRLQQYTLRDSLSLPHAKISRLTHLQVLGLSECPELAIDFVINFRPEMTNLHFLKRLHLCGCGIDDHQLAILLLGVLPNFPTATHLVLSENNIQSFRFVVQGLRDLGTVTPKIGLRHLDITSNPIEQFIQDSYYIPREVEDLCKVLSAFATIYFCDNRWSGALNQQNFHPAIQRELAVNRMLRSKDRERYEWEMMDQLPPPTIH